MTDEKKDASERVYASMDDIFNAGAGEVEYATIDGFKPGDPKIRIGSVTAGDIMEWSEANEEAKKTAGLRLVSKSLVGPEPHNTRYADNPKFLEKLKQLRHKDAERIVREILKLNGMNVKEKDAKNG